MSENKYLVSAIVSAYNCERFIEGCLQDLEDQTIASTVEIIVINSGSQQNEKAIIRRFQKRFDNIVYIKTEERETIYRAWNRGIKIAAGKYITNANADDRHRKDAFEIMVNVLENNNDIGLVYPNYIETETENETFDSCTPVGYLDILDYDRFELLFKCLPAHQPMWRKSIHDEYGYFDENLKVAGDREFWLRISEKYKFKHIDEYLGLYLRYRNSAERREPENSVSEVGAVINKYINNKYITSISGNKELIKKVRARQSEVAFYHGDFFFNKGNVNSAKKVLFRSIVYNWRNLKSYQLLLACYLSPRLVILLRSIKKDCKKIFFISGK